jgi:hypothetical protein
MQAVRHRIRACAWLALLAIVALAVGPTVSRMRLPANGSGMHEAGSLHVLATATASTHAMGSAHHHQDRTMQPGPLPAAPQAPPHDHALEHCGLCLLAAHAFAFAHTPPALVAVRQCSRLSNGQVAPAAPRLRSDWSPASSRGPPILA